MMTYTRSAIGLLTRQYRSVLRKCFLINCGLFALGAVLNSANAAGLPEPTLDKLHEQDPTTYPNGSVYSLGNDETTFPYIQYQIENGIITKTINKYALVNNQGTGDTKLYYKWEINSDGYVRLYDGDISGYDFIVQYDSSQVQERTTPGVGENVTGVFYNLSGYFSGNAIFALSNIGNITGIFIRNKAATTSQNKGGAVRINNIQASGIIGDFISNYASGSNHALGGGIYNLGTINGITGNFISNFASSGSNNAYGGAINNTTEFGSSAQISKITGDFINNYVWAWSYAGGGAIYNDQTITNITGDFINNQAISSIRSGQGGAIQNKKIINSIKGNFIGNNTRTSGSYEALGGSIYNYGTGTNIGSIVGNFTGNYSLSKENSASGGAIYNYGGVINSISGNFIGNYAETTSTYSDKYASGGAIFNGSNPISYSSSSIITLSDTTFINNYVNNQGAMTLNSIYNAGIIKIKNDATVTINDGWQSYSSGQLVMLGTGSVLNMNIGNSTIQNDSLGAITNVGTINATVDIDLTDVSAPEADTITVSSVTQEGFINLTGLKLKGTLDNYKGNEYTKRILINSNSSSDLKLKIAMATTTDNKYVLQQGEKTPQSDEFEGTAKWTDAYGKYNLSTDIVGTIEAVDGTTEKDSIKFTVTGTQQNKSDIVSDGDTLQIVNNSGLATRNFSATTDGESYTVKDDVEGGGLGKAGAGIININGKPDGADNNGTIDLNGKTGFELDKATTLNLNNVKLTNATGDIIDAGATAVVNLNNAEIDGSMTNAGVINSNNAVLGGNVIGMGDAVLNITGDTEMGGVVTNHTLNVSNAKLTVNSGNLVASDSLNAKSGSEIDIVNNKVNLDKVSFESGSKLNLKVNSLSDFGGIEANNITVENGAELSATLAQGIQNGTVQLLKANNANFNNFADSFDNKMYVFEKADKNGLYNIKLAKTAEEVAEEAGGTTTEARAAAAWVDGDQFEEGTTAAKVADAMADLAQNDPQEFTKALSVVAPQEAPNTQSEAMDMTDKLLLTVGKYLSNQDIGGLSSGDALQDVTVWAKGYYGESKLSNNGKVKGFDTKNKGVIAGFDKKLNKAVKVGAGFQYNDSDVDAYHRDVEIDSLVGFIYGEYRPSKWFVSGVTSFGKSDYDEEKYALGVKIKDKYSANVYSLQALTGYDFQYVTPEIGARYYRIKRHGYEDNIGQSVSGKDMDLLRGVFGLRSSYEFGMFKPEIYAGITYDFVSDEDNALVSLPNGSSYTVDGRRLKRFGTEFSANITAQITDNTSLGAGYEGKFREHYQDHTGMISVKYEF